MARWALAGLVVAAAAPPLGAECISIRPPNPLARLRASSAVYAAEVLSIGEKPGTAKVKVLRSWKGSSGPYTWSGVHHVKPGEVYLVYEEGLGSGFEYECDYLPIPLARARDDIAALDRYRRYPRFRAPGEKR